MSQDNNRISGDIIYNYISVAVTAICGAVFSIIIGYYYDAAVLGRFNTIYAYYIVLSQFCVCGVHMAIVKYAAEEGQSGYGISLLIKSISVCICSSLTVIGSGAIVTNLFLIHILSSSMIKSINTIWIALLFFSINKVFLGWLNGHLRMRAYACFQASRNLIIALSLLIFAINDLSGEILTYCFLTAELLLFVFELLFILVSADRKIVEKTTVSFRALIWFSLRILPSNAVLELNTKVDVICLSFILNDERLIGIYTFAAMFGEGFYQLFVVIRKVINPKITQHHVAHSLKDYIHKLTSKYMIWIYLGFSITGTLLIGGFVVLVHLLGKNYYLSGINILCILCIAMVLNSKSIIFGNILAQTGHPFDESVLNIITTASNGLLNIILIIKFDMIGAALATGLSYFVYNFTQKYQVKRKLLIKL